MLPRVIGPHDLIDIPWWILPEALQRHISASGGPPAFGLRLRRAQEHLQIKLLYDGEWNRRAGGLRIGEEKEAVDNEDPYLLYPPLIGGCIGNIIL